MTAPVSAAGREPREQRPPNPGSQAAIDAGCICPVVDNAYGRGAYRDVDGEPQFWYSHGCRVHFPDPASPSSPREQTEEGR